MLGTASTTGSFYKPKVTSDVTSTIDQETVVRFCFPDTASCSRMQNSFCVEGKSIYTIVWLHVKPQLRAEDSCELILSWGMQDIFCDFLPLKTPKYAGWYEIKHEISWKASVYGKFVTTKVFFFNKCNHLTVAEKVSSYGRSHMPYSSLMKCTLNRVLSCKYTNSTSTLRTAVLVNFYPIVITTVTPIDQQLNVYRRHWKK